MSKNTKTVISTVMVLFIIGYTALCLRFNKSIPPQYIAMIAIAVECFYAVPLMVIKYFKLYERPLGGKTFIAFFPHINYISCMGKVLQILCNLSLGITVLAIILLFTSGWLSIMPDTFILNYQDYMTSIVVIMSTVYNILVGIGLYQATVDVRRIYQKNLPSVEAVGFYKFLDNVVSYLPFAEFPILALPLIRSVSIIGTINRMEDLSRLGITAFTDIEEDY